jgi:hypothetical protein
VHCFQIVPRSVFRRLFARIGRCLSGASKPIICSERGSRASRTGSCAGECDPAHCERMGASHCRLQSPLHGTVRAERGLPKARRRGVARGDSASRLILATHACYLTAALPALATSPSCSPLPPETPTAPISLPSMIIGTPPSIGIAPVRRNNRRPSPPAATLS